MLAALLTIALAALCGCVPPEEMLRNPLDETFTGNEVVIGAALPLSGAYAEAGKEMLQGAQIAIRTLNAGRGVGGRRVRLEVADTCSTSSGARQAMSKLALKGAAAVAGGYTTQETEGLASGANIERLPLAVACATADKFSNSGLFVFRTSCSDTQQAQGLAAYLWYWRQMQRICVLMDNSPEAVCERNNARAVAASFRDLGGTVTDTPVYRDNNFSKAINEALITGPQAIIVSARGKRAAAILAELRQKGYKGAICGTDGWDTPEFFKSLTVKDPGDCVYISCFTPSETSEEFKDFSAGFRRRHFHEPGNLETISYDALKLLAIGLGRAESLRDFRKNWLAICNHFGCAATYTMLRRGKVDRTMYINAIEPAKANGLGCQGRLLRSFMHSRLATYRY